MSGIPSDRSAGPFAGEKTRGRLVALAAVIFAAAAFGLTYGLTAPLIAIDLSARGYSHSTIGLNAAMHAVGVLAIAPLLPSLANRYGHRKLSIAALLLSATALAALACMPAIWYWFPLRLLLGAGAETVLVLTETWANELSAEASRGRTMAIYTASMALGFAGGPAILSRTGADSSAYFLGAAIAVVAILPLTSPWVRTPSTTEPAISHPWRYARVAPLAIAASFLNAAVETAGLSFVASYAIGLGWQESDALQLISTLLLGAIVLQLPVGWLADRVDSHRLLLALAILSVSGAFVWPWVLNSHSVAYAVVFLWGGLFVGIETTMLTVVGRRFTGGDLVGVYAVMSLTWGVGAFIGPALAGVAMHLNPAVGLPYAVAVLCALFAVFLNFSRRQT